MGFLTCRFLYRVYTLLASTLCKEEQVRSLNKRKIYIWKRNLETYKLCCRQQNKKRMISDKTRTMRRNKNEDMHRIRDSYILEGRRQTRVSRFLTLCNVVNVGESCRQDEIIAGSITWLLLLHSSFSSFR